MPTEILSFLSQPFTGDVSPTTVFLIVGLAIVSLWAWHMIFKEISVVSGDVA